MNNSLIFLVQTDTTVGFLSNDSIKISSIKNRPSSKKILQEVDSFKTLKNKLRIPKNFRKQIRNSNITTYIYPNNESYRVVSNQSNHHRFIKKFNILYSSSANITKHKFDIKYALEKSDISLNTNEDYSEKKPSKIYKINKNNMIKIR